MLKLVEKIWRQLLAEIQTNRKIFSIAFYDIALFLSGIRFGLPLRGEPALGPLGRFGVVALVVFRTVFDVAHPGHRILPVDVLNGASVGTDNVIIIRAAGFVWEKFGDDVRRGSGAIAAGQQLADVDRHAQHRCQHVVAVFVKDDVAAGSRERGLLRGGQISNGNTFRRLGGRHRLPQRPHADAVDESVKSACGHTDVELLCWQCERISDPSLHVALLRFFVLKLPHQFALRVLHLDHVLGLHGLGLGEVFDFLRLGATLNGRPQHGLNLVREIRCRAIRQRSIKFLGNEVKFALGKSKRAGSSNVSQRIAVKTESAVDPHVHRDRLLQHLVNFRIQFKLFDLGCRQLLKQNIHDVLVKVVGLATGPRLVIVKDRPSFVVLCFGFDRKIFLGDTARMLNVGAERKVNIYLDRRLRAVDGEQFDELLGLNDVVVKHPKNSPPAVLIPQATNVTFQHQLIKTLPQAHVCFVPATAGLRCVDPFWGTLVFAVCCAGMYEGIVVAKCANGRVDVGRRRSHLCR